MVQQVNTLLNHGFTQWKNDYSMLMKETGEPLVIILVYVDDIILARANFSVVTVMKSLLQSIFKVKELGNLEYFLD